jgi:hypothetical protein
MPLSGEALYRAFRHAPVEKMKAAHEAALKEGAEKRSQAHKARVEAFEKQKAPYREVMSSLLKDHAAMKSLKGDVPKRPKRPKLSTAGLSFPPAPTERYIRRGSISLIDLPPFEGRQATFSSGDAEIDIGEPFTNLSAGVGGIGGGAGAGPGNGGGSASGFFGIGQYFSPPQPSNICGETSGLLWFSASPSWWNQSCEFYSNFAAATFDLWVALEIVQFSGDGNTLMDIPISMDMTKQTVVSHWEFGIQEFSGWPDQSGVPLLSAPPIPVSSPYNYGCFVFCGMDTSGSGSSSWTSVGGGMRLGSLDLVFDSFS